MPTLVDQSLGQQGGRVDGGDARQDRPVRKVGDCAEAPHWAGEHLGAAHDTPGLPEHDSVDNEPRAPLESPPARRLCDVSTGRASEVLVPFFVYGLAFQAD